jgi:glyoxylase-like metal-dependent hydrolase (beta-lactamase superfamily II)
VARYTSLILLVGALCAQHPLTVSAQDLAPKIIKDTLADGIYLLRAPQALDSWTATNCVVIVNDDDVVVFDSFTRPSTARLAIAEIRAITSKPVRTLINSHWHQDHWRGNGEFKEAYPGIRIVTTMETRNYMRHMSNGFLTDSTRVSLAQRREALAEAVKTGKLADGTPLTPELRRDRERALATRTQFFEEMIAAPFVLPDVAYRGELTFWSGSREFRLLTMTGDATGSAVLYLPAEKLLVTGDVLASPEDGSGPPPWTTNSYAIRPWLDSLRRLDALDAVIIVPGQGPAMRDESYLRLTVELFTSVVSQVDAALVRGLFKVDEVVGAVDLDAIGKRYPGGRVGPDTPFGLMSANLVRKALQEALDGGVR